MKIKLSNWPVIKQVAGLVRGAKTVGEILGFITGQRTQKLLTILGLIVAIGQPVVAHFWPEYNDLVLKIMAALGVGAGITFADKINRLIEAIKEAGQK